MPAGRTGAVHDWRTPAGLPATEVYFRGVQELVVGWWRQHKRGDLPWRLSAEARRRRHECAPDPQATHAATSYYDPYEIWVSEVMSQQTQLGTVIKYYTRWMDRFPTIAVLARSSDDEVRALWSGLGYYRRAAYLLQGARYLLGAATAAAEGAEGQDVQLPRTASDLRRVPGIGPYTAAAIASVCYNEPVIAVDGNVVRVLSRLRAERDFDPKLPRNLVLAREWGRQLMQGGRDGATEDAVCGDPGALNLGLMELGGAICRPAGPPLCERCPLSTHCAAFAARQRGELPAIEGVIPLRARAAVRREEQVLCVVHELRPLAATEAERRFVVVRRPVDGLLGGMMEFPSLNLTHVADEARPSTSLVLPLAERRRRLRGLACVTGTGSARRTAPSGAEGTTPPQVRPCGTVRHIFSHINMLVEVYHVVWPVAAADAEVRRRTCGRRKVGASSAADVFTENEVLSRVAAALRDSTPAEARRNGEAAIERRMTTLTVAELRQCASSRLLFKILHAVQHTATSPSLPQPRKRRRSVSHRSDAQ